MNKIFIKGFIYGAITIFLVVFILYVSSNAMKLSQVEVVLEKSWLEQKLKILDYKSIELVDFSVFPIEYLNAIYDGILINKMYISNDKRVQAFHYQIDSGYLGIAVIKYDLKEKIKSIEFYNQFDLNLKKLFKPSHILLVFTLGAETVVYDGFSESIYIKKGETVIKAD